MLEVIGAVISVILFFLFYYIGIKAYYFIEQHYRKKHGLNVETFHRWAAKKALDCD